MNSSRTYLDYNATSPLRPEARAAMLAALDLTANASSVHAEGRRARGIIEDAREKVARFAGARPSEVVFTSGATEANNWALSGPWSEVYVSAVEHDSVREPARRGRKAAELAVDVTGEVDLSPLQPGTGLVAIQTANNETGVVQDIPAIAEVVHAAGQRLHTDAVQAAGRLPLAVATAGADSIALSSHKIGGPMGAGALIVRGEDFPPALFAGGGQERRRRSGTENVAAIAGFGAAAETAQRDLANIAVIAKLRDRLEDHLLTVRPDAVIAGRVQNRLANTICIAAPGTRAETLMIKLDLAGFAISSGAACSSGKVGQSHVLTAMGFPPELAGAALRISIGFATTADEIDAFAAAWSKIVSQSALAA